METRRERYINSFASRSIPFSISLLIESTVQEGEDVRKRSFPKVHSLMNGSQHMCCAVFCCVLLCFAVLCCALLCNSVSKFLFSNIFHLISFLIWCSLPIYWLQHSFRISKSSRCALEIFYWIFNSLLQCNFQFFRFISNSNFSIATAEKFLFLNKVFFHALVNFWRISIDSLIDFFLLVLILQDS